MSPRPAPALVLPLVSVVVITFNSRETLGACLNSIMGLRGARVELVVVDNGSGDGSLELVRQYCPTAHLLCNEVNRGFSAACNQGIDAGTGDYVLLVNSDVTLAPDFLTVLISPLAANPQAGWASGKLLLWEGGHQAEERIDTAGAAIFHHLQVRDRGAGEVDRGQYNRAEWVFGVSAAAALYKRAMLDDLRWHQEIFDEDFFAYYEDADLNWRAQWRNWWCWYDPQAVAFHRRGHATSHSLPIQRHATANRLLMIIKNASPAVLRACTVPWLIFELYLFFKTLLFKSEWLPAYAKVWRLWGKMQAKRRAILAERMVGDDQLLRWFQSEDWFGLLRQHWTGWYRSLWS